MDAIGMDRTCRSSGQTSVFDPGQTSHGASPATSARCRQGKIFRLTFNTASKAGQDRAHEGRSMSTVKSALAQKSGSLVHVRSGDMVVEALRQMRENRVRSVLVIDDDVLVGIVTQGDCAIKVLLPGLDAKETPVGQVMTGNPVTVKPDDPLKDCMAMMAERGFRHLPVLDAGKVVGVISIGDVVKNIIRDLEHNVGDLMGYIMKDGPGG